MKVNSFNALAEELNRRQAIAAAEAERQANIEAQMAAMWSARESKLAADRKAQMSRDWYLHN